MAVNVEQFGPIHVPSVAALGGIRHRFESWMASLCPSAVDHLQEIAVVLSELGSNALSATPTGRSSPTIHGSFEDGLLTIEVCNHVDASEEAAADWDPDDPLRPRGRGLLLVSAFSDEVTVEAHRDQVAVSCCMRIAAPA